jgi:K+/H+ antiporter YhaU regulatory subunit KhtT
MRNPDGSFTTNPSSDTELDSAQILIAIGTEDQLQRLRHEAEVA